MSKAYYDNKAQQIKRFTQELSTLNREIAIEAINFFKESFDNQGFTDSTLVPWRRTKSGKQNRFGQTSSGILIQTGALKDSFDYRINGAIITILNSKEYAAIHNEGGTISHPGGTSFYPKGNEAIFVSKRKAAELKALRGLKLPKTKPHKIPIPRRKFIGTSKVLNQRIERLIIRKFLKALEI